VEEDALSGTRRNVEKVNSDCSGCEKEAIGSSKSKNCGDEFMKNRYGVLRNGLLDSWTGQRRCDTNQ